MFKMNPRRCDVFIVRVFIWTLFDMLALTQHDKLVHSAENNMCPQATSHSLLFISFCRFKIMAVH